MTEDTAPATDQPTTSPTPDEADVTLTAGESDVLTLHPQDDAGNPIGADQLGGTVQWTEDSGGAVLALEPSQDGLSCTVNAIAEGTAHVTATLSSVSDQATFTVEAAAPPAPPTPPTPPAPVVADLGLEAGEPYPTPAAGAGASAPAGSDESPSGSDATPPGGQAAGAPAGTAIGNPPEGPAEQPS